MRKELLLSLTVSANPRPAPPAGNAAKAPGGDVYNRVQPNSARPDGDQSNGAHPNCIRPNCIRPAVTCSDLEHKRETIRQMFDRARQLREPEVMAVCLRRLLALSEILGDNAAVRHYRTLHLLLQPALRGRHREDGLRDNPSGLDPIGQSPTGSSLTGDDNPGKRATPTNEPAPPFPPDQLLGPPILEARGEGWLPTPAYANCILSGRFPALTPAETCHFAESRTGILCLVAETPRDIPPSPQSFRQPPLPAIALIFNGCYSGAWRPAFAPADTDCNALALDTVAIWQMDRQSGWSAFLEMTPGHLTRFLDGLPGAPLDTSIDTGSFSQLLFYRLTDLETIRARH